MKLCIITCYSQPDYIRARTLRVAADQIDGVDVIVVKNSSTGILRYPQVLLKTLITRFSEKPDAYILTFRGYEMLAPIRILSAGKPLIYDEFINPIEWAVFEHHKISKTSPVTWLLKAIYKLLLKSVDMVLTDTKSHADLSSELMQVAREKFHPIPVGTDEATFVATETETRENELFTVFYYGNMLPLHGLRYVIEAAIKMKDESAKFVLVGGSAETAQQVAQAVSDGANIDYEAWVEYEKLPQLISEADLCLAGPFGATFQSKYVITGKAFQYLAMARPIVVGENKESHVFIDKKDALVVTQGSAESLLTVIRWAMSHRNQLDSLGASGKTLYGKQFASEHLSERLSDALRRLNLLESAARTEK